MLDQESTFFTIASQTNLCWVLLLAQGDTTTYMRTSPLSELMHAGRVSGSTYEVSTALLVIPSDSETPPTTGPAKELLKLCYHEHAASTRTTSKKRKGITSVAPLMYSIHVFNLIKGDSFECSYIQVSSTAHQTTDVCHSYT